MLFGSTHLYEQLPVLVRKQENEKVTGNRRSLASNGRMASTEKFKPDINMLSTNKNQQVLDHILIRRQIL
jgi:hypothetical protein